MKKMNNTETIQGRIFNHTLSIKQVKNKESANFGQDFINGTINVAIDEDGLSVIPVEYRFVKKTTSKGAPNKTYTTLMNIITDGKTWETDGKDAATKVKITASLGVNDFVNKDNEITSYKINAGSFIDIVTKLPEIDKERHSFTVDILMTKATLKEADGERIKEDYLVIKGAVFDFRGTLMPVELVVRNKNGIDAFQSLEPSNSNPVLNKVWGIINFHSETETKVEETLFGEQNVTTYTKENKEWLITGANPEPYDFGDEAVLTVEEVQKASQEREVYLAEVRKKHDDYINSLKTPEPKSVDEQVINADTIKKSGFNF